MNLGRNTVSSITPHKYKNTQVIIWTQEKEESSYGQDYDLQYKAGQCLQCGCCLEVCPNFLSGCTFGGAAAMAEAYKAIEQNEHSEHRTEMISAYRTHFFSGCGQALSCRDVCPIKLPLDEIQTRTNGQLMGIRYENTLYFKYQTNILFLTQAKLYVIIILNNFGAFYGKRHFGCNNRM